jgi:putative SOS response-associated peptidase YedK
MCGRFVSARKRLELLEEFAVERDTVAADRDPDYNVAPTKRIYAVLNHAEPEQPGERELRLVRWGLVPFWAKDTKGGARMINARAETVGVKPAFRAAFAKRRCLIPADGYYEWQTEAAISRGDDPPYPPGQVRSKGKNIGPAAKKPFYIYRTDGGILAFAGIYEIWHDRTLPDDHENAWYWSASIITTDAPDDIGKIHDRTPMVIAPNAWADWLDPANNEKDHLLATMIPATSAGISGLTSHRVAPMVNSVRNNGPDLIEPLAETPDAETPDAESPGDTERPAL